jgi:2-polyprenyl-3-methyl-5-hydroxy-6-metoxy-1,4-benzoquinol methylase
MASRRLWNHNLHYHDLVLRAIPPGCGLALDVGCGAGLLTRRLAAHCNRVIGIEIDHDTVERAKADAAAEPRLTFIEGDVMTHAWPEDSFDLITAVATLHHLPLRPALDRFRKLLKPGGTLAVIGLYHNRSIADYVIASIALPSSWILRRLFHHQKVAAPVQEPVETIEEIRKVCATLLPGATVQRRLFFRYSMIWHKP